MDPTRVPVRTFAAFRSMRRRLRCLRQTRGMHELDFHLGVCRFCKRPLPAVHQAKAETRPTPDPKPQDGAPRTARGRVSLLIAAFWQMTTGLRRRSD